MKPAVLLVLAVVCAMAGLATADPPYPSTFSIVAADPETGEVAKFLLAWPPGPLDASGTGTSGVR